MRMLERGIAVYGAFLIFKADTVARWRSVLLESHAIRRAMQTVDWHALVPHWKESHIVVYAFVNCLSSRRAGLAVQVASFAIYVIRTANDHVRAKHLPAHIRVMIELLRSLNLLPKISYILRVPETYHHAYAT